MSGPNPPSDRPDRHPRASRALHHCTQASTPSTTPGSGSPSRTSTPVLTHTSSHTSVKETSYVNLDYDPVSGRTTLNTYEVIKELGRGQHGKVKLGRDLATGEYVAIKVVDRLGKPKLGKYAQLRKDPSDRNVHEEAVKREIAILKKCENPHIVRLLEVMDDVKSRKIFMVLEYCEGGELVWQNEDGTPSMTMDEARQVFRDVLLGLEYLHFQGVIHRDIKPANLLLCHKQVKISDFGVSFTSAGDTTDEIELAKTAGTPAFFAPELCQNNPGKGNCVTNKIDIWALGVTLYCLLFGKVPFSADSEYELFEVICRDKVTFPDTDTVSSNSSKPESSATTPGSSSAAINTNASAQTLSVQTASFSPNSESSQFSQSSESERSITSPTSQASSFSTASLLTSSRHGSRANLSGATSRATSRDATTAHSTATATREPRDLSQARMSSRSSLSRYFHRERHDSSPDQTPLQTTPDTDMQLAHDLILKLLEKDPHKRITIQEIKDHPWTQMNMCNEEAREFNEAANDEQRIEITNEDLQTAVSGIGSKIKKGLTKLGSSALAFAGIKRRGSGASTTTTTRGSTPVGSPASFQPGSAATSASTSCIPDALPSAMPSSVLSNASAPPMSSASTTNVPDHKPSPQTVINPPVVGFDNSYDIDNSYGIDNSYNDDDDLETPTIKGMPKFGDTVITEGLLKSSLASEIFDLQNGPWAQTSSDIASPRFPPILSSRQLRQEPQAYTSLDPGRVSTDRVSPSSSTVQKSSFDPSHLQRPSYDRQNSGGSRLDPGSRSFLPLTSPERPPHIIERPPVSRGLSIDSNDSSISSSSSTGELELVVGRKGPGGLSSSITSGGNDSDMRRPRLVSDSQIDRTFERQNNEAVMPNIEDIEMEDPFGGEPDNMSTIHSAHPSISSEARSMAAGSSTSSGSEGGGRKRSSTITNGILQRQRPTFDL
ncbi:Serine/threonine-protein kinase ssp1 [Yarrowia sp. E02]|nr:Serine/threonine-protein kinase ssp1 [Yarrowia sp. E02]